LVAAHPYPCGLCRYALFRQGIDFAKIIVREKPEPFLFTCRRDRLRVIQKP
jgi:hypothetical protein